MNSSDVFVIKGFTVNKTKRTLNISVIEFLVGNLFRSELRFKKIKPVCKTVFYIRPSNSNLCKMTLTQFMAEIYFLLQMIVL